MKYKMEIKSTIILCFIAILISSCSNTPTRKKYNDDAIRVKPEYWKDYSVEPNTKKSRNGATLRGNVYKVVTTVNVDTCNNATPQIIQKSFVYFLDSLAFDSEKPKIEIIPSEAIDFVGPKIGTNPLGINWFENYNNPMNSSFIREVKNDTIMSVCQNIVPDSSLKPRDSSKIRDCNCEPFDLNIGLDCQIRAFRNTFFELRGLYGVYSDVKVPELTPVGRDFLSAEIAYGFRFGEKNYWGFGMAYSLPVAIVSKTNFTKVSIPLLNFHLKRNFEPFWCMSPYTYIQIGLALDKASIDLLKFQCSDCQAKVNTGNLNLGLPITYGFGAGLDIPFISLFDLSFDIGYRNLAIGEPNVLFGYGNVPSLRRVDMLLMRFGFSY